MWKRIIEWLFHSNLLMNSGNLAPGQIWEDVDHVFHCEERLRFACVLLSADTDKEDGNLYWTVADFMQYTFGAQIRKFLPEEVLKFRYVGHIQAFKKKNKL